MGAWVIVVPNPVFAIALLAVVASCAEPRRAQTGSPDSVASTSSGPATVPSTTLSSAQAVASGAFDPEGYYFPLGGLSVAQHELEWVAIWREFVRLSLQTGAGESTMHNCPQATITRDTLDIVCPDTPIGGVRIAGKFVDAKGKFWNRGDIQPQTALGAGGRDQEG